MFTFLALWGNSRDFAVVCNFAAVVRFKPLAERGRVDAHNAAFHKCIGSHQLIVGCVVHNFQDTGFPRAYFTSPTEVTSFKPQSAEFKISSPASYDAHALVTRCKFGHGSRATKLELSLLNVNLTPTTSVAAFVTAVSADTHD